MYLEKNPKTRPIVKKFLELEDKILGRAFPQMKRTRQKSVYACGPATLEMLFSYIEISVSQTSLIRSIRVANKIKLYGIDVHDMARAAKIAGHGEISFWKKQNANVSDLDKAINKYKYPVGVEWQGIFYENEDEDSGHYGVITKIDTKGDSLRISDPYFNGYFEYNGVDRKLKISEFKKKWWDTNEVKIAGRSKLRMVKDIRIMFVITEKGASWPKKLGMKKG